jgi:ABC-type transport system involved in cytochrome c biogenesis ATPase subunit
MNLGGHGKLVRIAMGIFQVRNGHVQTRKDDESKVRKGELSKVMIGIAE